MAKLMDLTGQRFGRLVALKYEGRTKSYQSRWLVLCDCGNQTIVLAGALKSKKTQSCGCLQRERTSKAKTTHGLYHDQNRRRSKLNRVWCTMKERCQNPNSKSFKDYGGRGITICDEWQKYQPFFVWAMLHGYQEGLQIERMNNDGNYEPDNCRWATKKEQGKNKRNNITISFNGKTQILREWADELQVDRRLLEARVKRGWPPERILTVRKMKNQYAWEEFYERN